MDDIIIKREPCEIQPNEAIPQIQSDILVTCDFENRTTCFWTKDVEVSKFNWAIKGEGDIVPTLGPDNGALSSKSYIYASRSLSYQGKVKR